MHWDFELEYWPQPADRKLAGELIDEGVDAVVGMHSHVPQGVEWHKEKPILYGLGNFWFPPRRIGGFELRFPEQSNRQLVPQIRLAGREVENLALHWLRADAEANTLTVETVEDSAGPNASELTPFSGMSQAEYEKWFTAHRVKRRFLPVYRDHRHTVRNFLRGAFVGLRQKGIDILKKSGLKRGLSHSRLEGKQQ
jgi:poly-gamma-glutamate synthesis protein (capsule biosynthesis protein)